MKAIVATLLVLFGTTAYAASDRTSEDWNKCKKAALESYEDSQVEVKKIRGRSIDMKVKTPEGEVLLVTCFRNDYTLVVK